MNNEKLLVFDIEKFAVHDGPGIRTVVFLKGCPLKCVWCHNPESQSFRSELLFDPGKCSRCGRCAAICPQNAHLVTENKHLFLRSRCRGCALCPENCPSEALRLSGKAMSVPEIMDEVMKDLPFYRTSGGGITLSGGEPLSHIRFTSDLLKAAKANGLHTAIETCGFSSWEKIETILPFTDLWLWDIKALPEKHQDLTGVPFEPILDNLKKLSASGASIILRCPLVPGINDEDAHLFQIARLANELPGIREINLEPYHPMGEGKGVLLGREHIFHANFASDADKNRWKKIISSRTEVPCHIS